MGRIATVLSHARRALRGALFGDVKMELGGGDIVTGEHFQPAGYDGVPLPGDKALAVDILRGGGVATAGTVDTSNAGSAQPGEARIYARNGGGAVVVQVFARADGSVVINNGNGSFTLEPGGDVTINGVRIDTDGNIETPGDVTSEGTVTGETDVVAGVAPATVGLRTHTHTGNLGLPTSPPTPGT